MRSFIFLLLLAVVSPCGELDNSDIRSVLELQRDQLRKFSRYHILRADMLQAERDLDRVNQLIEEKVAALRKKYSCPGCQLGDDLKWLPLPNPLPDTPTVKQNK